MCSTLFLYCFKISIWCACNSFKNQLRPFFFFLQIDDVLRAFVDESESWIFSIKMFHYYSSPTYIWWNFLALILKYTYVLMKYKNWPKNKIKIRFLKKRKKRREIVETVFPNKTLCNLISMQIKLSSRVYHMLMHTLWGTLTQCTRKIYIFIMEPFLDLRLSSGKWPGNAFCPLPHFSICAIICNYYANNKKYTIWR